MALNQADKELIEFAANVIRETMITSIGGTL